MPISIGPEGRNAELFLLPMLPEPSFIDPTCIRAITLDLDDTLWPIWPTIHRAEAVLLQWLQQHAPATAQIFNSPQALRAIRERVGYDRPDLRYDLSALRRESIHLALTQAGDDPTLAQPAFDVFFAERQRVQLFDDALPALQFLSAHWPVVAVSNGNADVGCIGIGHFFHDTFNVLRVGAAKPQARIFHAAMHAVGVAAHEVVHVGDDPVLDVTGARNAGIQHAIWLNRDGKDWPIPEIPPATITSLTQLCQMLGA